MELVQHSAAKIPKGNRDGRCGLDERGSNKDVSKRDKTNASWDLTQPETSRSPQRPPDLGLILFSLG